MNSPHPSPLSFRRRLPAGFTLIELLVVIAIIAISAALIFPAMNAVQRKGYQTTSLSNLHQWFAGFAASVGDNDGEMPTPGSNAPDPANEQDWYNRLPAGMKQPTYAQLQTIGRPQLGTRSIWINPAVPVNAAVGGFTFCYGYNDQLVDTQTPGAAATLPLKMVRIQVPSFTVLMGEKADASPSLNYNNVRTYFSAKDPKTDGEGVANFLFCDGHTESIKRSVFADPLAQNSKAFEIKTLGATMTWRPYSTTGD